MVSVFTYHEAQRVDSLWCDVQPPILPPVFIKTDTLSGLHIIVSLSFRFMPTASNISHEYHIRLGKRIWLQLVGLVRVATERGGSFHNIQC